MPNTPVKAAGMRIEPAPAVPRGRRPKLSSAAAAAPPEEPPVVRSSFHGLRVMPVSGLWHTPIQPNSGRVVLPRKTAPCSRRRAPAGAIFLGKTTLPEKDCALLAQARDRRREQGA